MKSPVVRFALASITALSLVACIPTQEQNKPTSPETTSVSTPTISPTTSKHTPTPAATPTPEGQSRGVAKARMPGWIRSNQGLVAAEFVLLANSPDSRLDKRPTNSWRRACKLCSPDLAKEIDNQKDTAGGGWWTSLLENDGWVSVDIGNVLGDHPQAVGEPELVPGEEALIEVVFSRAYHLPGRPPKQEGRELRWAVTVKGGKVVEFDPAGLG